MSVAYHIARHFGKDTQRAKGLIVNCLPYSKTFQGVYNLHIKNSASKSRYFTGMYVTKIEIQGESNFGYVSQGP